MAELRAHPVDMFFRYSLFTIISTKPTFVLEGVQLYSFKSPIWQLYIFSQKSTINTSHQDQITIAENALQVALGNFDENSAEFPSMSFNDMLPVTESTIF